METEFGWTLGGYYSTPSSSSALTCCFTQHASSGILDLDEEIEKFIELESCGDSKIILSPEKIYCIESYNKTTHQNETGQVIVNLPVKISI